MADPAASGSSRKIIVCFRCGNNYLVTDFSARTMMGPDASQERFSSWIAALDERHLANLTPSEVARALRALSSCYVERREKLATGVALGTAGKRAAFALFYGPVHFLVAREVVRALEMRAVREIVDLGCGSGAAGAAWALEAGGASISGFDRNPWAVTEAQWTYRTLGLRGRARQADITRFDLRLRGGLGIIAAYTLNELPASGRHTLLPLLIDAAGRGARVLVLEPIARRSAPWWGDWKSAFVSAGGAANEWRFPAALPARTAGLARAAGLDPRELTARSLSL